MNMNRHIWEGWTPKHFVEELSVPLDMIMKGQSWKKPLKNKAELADWCADNQPYYKEAVPEVVEYFAAMYGLH